MANSTSIQLLDDGPRNTVLKFEGVLDTADLTSTTVVDPAVQSPIDTGTGLKAVKYVLQYVDYNVEDTLSLNLFWDATVQQRIDEYTGRGISDYTRFGGIPNNAGAGVTGKLNATTEGWAAAKILSFTAIIHLKKTDH
jgi:hypothetical protein